MRTWGAMPRIRWVDDMPLAKLIIWPTPWTWFIYVRRDLKPGEARRLLRRASVAAAMPTAQRHAAVVLIAFTAAMHGFGHMPNVLHALGHHSVRSALAVTAVAASAAAITASVYVRPASPVKPRRITYVWVSPQATDSPDYQAHVHKQRHPQSAPVVMITPSSQVPVAAAGTTPTPAQPASPSSPTTLAPCGGAPVCPFASGSGLASPPPTRPAPTPSVPWSVSPSPTPKVSPSQPFTRLLAFVGST